MKMKIEKQLTYDLIKIKYEPMMKYKKRSQFKSLIKWNISVINILIKKLTS
jgi:hypothetical protein